MLGQETFVSTVAYDMLRNLYETVDIFNSL